MSSSESLPDDFPTFSVFRALRVERHEVRHSNFLAWLINPRESHLQGTLFLRFFLDAIAKVVGEERPVAVKLGLPEAVSGSVEVSRESDRVDLRVVLPAVKVVVAIENIVFAAEQIGQLSRYAESIQRDLEGWDSVFLYLTLDGDVPSDDRWLPLTHRHMLEMITKGVEYLSPATPSAVRMFIEHYVDLLRDIYCNRPVVQRDPIVVKPSEPLHDTTNDAPTEKPPGWENFEALLRKIVQVPKAEVVKLIAEQKAARIERRCVKQNESER